MMFYFFYLNLLFLCVRKFLIQLGDLLALVTQVQHCTERAKNTSRSLSLIRFNQN